MKTTTENRKPQTENPAPKPKALVLYGYGLNCDFETQFALNKAGAEAVRVHTTELLENPAAIWNYHLLAVPGGFSWGDEHGAGVILALRLKLALGSALQEFIDAGRLVIGICNGFQVLVNLGLLPGLAGRPGERLAALIPNDCGNFRDAWVHLKVEPSHCVFTKGLDHLELPIRHGEGKFFAAPEVLTEIKDRGQIALKYATADGAEADGRIPGQPQRLAPGHRRGHGRHRPGPGPHAPPRGPRHLLPAPHLDPGEGNLAPPGPTLPRTGRRRPGHLPERGAIPQVLALSCRPLHSEGKRQFAHGRVSQSAFQSLKRGEPCSSPLP